MSFGGGGPAPAPIPAPLPPPPARSDAQTQALADEQRRKYAAGDSGSAQTYLTTSGTTDSSSAVRYLGGAAKT